MSNEHAARMVVTIDPGRVAAYYSQLQAAENPTELAAAVCFALDPILAQARDDADKARVLLDQAVDRVTQLEQLGAAARALIAGAEPDGTSLLRGRAIVDTAITVARAHGRAELHYTEWFTLLRGEGYLVLGAKPLDSFLTALTRHPRIERVGERTGVYRIVEAAS